MVVQRGRKARAIGQRGSLAYEVQVGKDGVGKVLLLQIALVSAR